MTAGPLSVEQIDPGARDAITPGRDYWFDFLQPNPVELISGDHSG